MIQMAQIRTWLTTPSFILRSMVTILPWNKDAPHHKLPLELVRRAYAREGIWEQEQGAKGG